MKQILYKVNEIAEVLNDTNGVTNVEWVKNNVNELQEVVKEICNLPVVVCSTWLFFYEGEKDKPQFKVQANTQWEAYQIAEETYGSQVEDMMYCML